MWFIFLSFDYQFFHGLVESIDGEWVHREKLADSPDGWVNPDPFVVRVEPDTVCEVMRKAFQPVDARLLVSFIVVDRAVPFSQFPRSHPGIADDDQLGVGIDHFQQVGGADAIESLDIFIQIIVDAVMEVIILEIPEMTAGMSGGK